MTEPTYAVLDPRSVHPEIDAVKLVSSWLGLDPVIHLQDGPADQIGARRRREA